jgi:hypothetical protein
MTKRTRFPRVARAGAIAVATGLAATTGLSVVPGVGAAPAGAATAKIFACYSDSTGEMFRVTSTKNCPTGETKISWNVEGPQGAQGKTGAQGREGKTGAKGPQGSAGAQGPQGVRGPQGPQGKAGAQGAPGPQGPPGAALGTYDYRSSTVTVHDDSPVVASMKPPGGEYIVNATAIASQAAVRCRILTVSASGRHTSSTPWGQGNVAGAVSVASGSAVQERCEAIGSGFSSPTAYVYNAALTGVEVAALEKVGTNTRARHIPANRFVAPTRGGRSNDGTTTSGRH